MSVPQTGLVSGVTPSTRLWHTGLHSLGTSIVSLALGLVMTIFIARSLGTTGKGNYDLVFATAALLGMVLGFSLQAGVTYVVARGRANLRALASRLTWIAIAQGFVSAAILYALRSTGYAKSFLPAPVGDSIIMAVAVYVTISGAANYWRAMLIGRQEIVQANRRDLVGRVAHVILLLAVIGMLAASQTPVSPATLIVVHLVVIVFANIILLQALKTSLRATYGTHGLREVADYAFPCYLGNLTQFLNYRLDVFVVSFFAGIEAVGLYTLAVFLGQLIWLISNAAATVLLPRVAASPGAVSENAGHAAQMTRIALWVSAGCALVLALVANKVLPWLYGEAFRASIGPLLWLLPGIVAFSAVNVLASYIGGIGKPRLNLYIALAGLSVTIALDLLLIPRLSIIGAAIASTASYSLSAILTVVFFIRESRIRLAKVVLPTGEDFGLIKSLARSTLHRAGFQQIG